MRSSRLQLRPPRMRLWPPTRLQTQVGQDLLDDGKLQDGGDDLQLTAKLLAMSDSRWPAAVREGSKLQVSQMRRRTLEPLDSITADEPFDARRSCLIYCNLASEAGRPGPLPNDS